MIVPENTRIESVGQFFPGRGYGYQARSRYGVPYGQVRRYQTPARAQVPPSPSPQGFVSYKRLRKAQKMAAAAAEAAEEAAEESSEMEGIF